jgi:hypothetical protein
VEKKQHMKTSIGRKRRKHVNGVSTTSPPLPGLTRVPVQRQKAHPARPIPPEDELCEPSSAVCYLSEFKDW